LRKLESTWISVGIANPYNFLFGTKVNISLTCDYFKQRVSVIRHLFAGSMRTPNCKVS